MSTSPPTEPPAEPSPSVEPVETTGDRPPQTHLDDVLDRELPRFAEALRRLGRG